MQTRDEKTGKTLWSGWNSPPNLVTYARILLVVIFLVLNIAAGEWGVNNLVLRWIAAILFIIAVSTDKVDGWMARKYDQVTDLGKLMDPIADKLLICSALVVASVFGELPWLATALFLVREIGITVMRLIVVDTGGGVIAAAWPGKLKTVFQSIGVSMLLLPVWSFVPGIDANPLWLNIYYWLAYALIYIALVLCLYSGAVYVINVFVKSKKATAV